VNIETFDQYRKAQRDLDAKNKAIDSQPGARVPLYIGIADLHAAVNRYEREHGLAPSLLETIGPWAPR
jgi:hypothetical protein